MKNNLLRLAGFLMLLFFSCEKWDYDTREFPEVLTTSIDAGNFNRTVANGRVLGLERGTLEQVGHCWSNNNTSLTLEQVAHTSLTGSAVAPDGSFESVLEGLSADTVYFLRAYAIYLSLGRRDTVYETGLKNFTPAPLNIIATSIRLEDVNVRVTSAITGLAQNTATAFGHCWSKQTEMPRIDDGVSQHSDFGSLDRDSVFEDYLPNLNLAETYHIRAYTIINGKTYYSNTLTIFVGDKWIRADFPIDYYRGNGFCLDDKIYFISAGGSTDLENRFWRYDPDTDNWSQIADFPGIARLEATSFTSAGKAYFGLGVGEDDYPLDFYAYTPVSNNWIEKAVFPGPPRIRATAFSINDRGYVSCGSVMYPTASSTFFDTWCYYPMDTSNGWDINGEPKGRWVKKADFSGGKRERAISFTIGESGYLGTGNTVVNGEEVAFNDFWEYQPNSLAHGLDETGQPKGEWVQRANASPFARSYASAFAIGGFGYLIGGEGSGYFTDCWRYDPSTDQWEAVNSVPSTPELTSAIGISAPDRGYIISINTFWKYIPFQ